MVERHGQACLNQVIRVSVISNAYQHHTSPDMIYCDGCITADVFFAVMDKFNLIRN